jgi:methyl-branched lipid omega-hydroxylase
MVNLDLGRQAFWEQPFSVRHEAFTHLRRHNPVSFHEEALVGGAPPGPGFWAVTRYEDVMKVSRTPEVFSSAKGVFISEVLGDPESQYPSMIAMDDPEHMRLRSLVQKRFTPRGIEDLENLVRTISVQAIEDIKNDGACDFVEKIAAAVPLKVICTLMGVAEEDYEELYSLTNVIVGGDDPRYAPTVQIRMAAMRRMGEIGLELARKKAEKPGDDLTSRLVRAQGSDVERLSEDELASFFMLLVGAGNETTRTAITHALIALTSFPEQRKAWQEDFDALAKPAVEEILRWSTPVISMRRTALEDIELQGAYIKSGQKVVMFYSSANRDSDVFDRPKDFDITREPIPHVSFGGGGPHFCLGAQLSRMEIRVLFEQLFQHLPDINAAGAPEILHSSFVNGISALPAAWAR